MLKVRSTTVKFTDTALLHIWGQCCGIKLTSVIICCKSCTRRVSPPFPVIHSPGRCHQLQLVKDLTCLFNDARDSLSHLWLLGHRCFIACVCLCAFQKSAFSSQSFFGKWGQWGPVPAKPYWDMSPCVGGGCDSGLITHNRNSVFWRLASCTVSHIMQLLQLVVYSLCPETWPEVVVHQGLSHVCPLYRDWSTSIKAWREIFIWF